MMRRRSEQLPSPDQILDACLEKIREEFARRIPIVRAYSMRGGALLEESYLYVRYVVETAAIEDAVDMDTRNELETRTRDQLLFSGYFRERRDVVSVLLVSEERLRLNCLYYERWMG